MNRNNLKHGSAQKDKKTKTYNAWIEMNRRCNNYNNKHYGGKGIKVCDKWSNKNKNGFINFLNDMGECLERLSLDRIDSSKGYYKENCRWATNKQQHRNQQSNKLFTYNNKTQCLKDWAKEYNINYLTLWCRIFKYRWNFEKALLTQIRVWNRK